MNLLSFSSIFGLFIFSTIFSFGQKVFEETVEPDYSNLHFWAAHPEKANPAALVPKARRNSISPILDVDVFFVHPTTFTAKNAKTWNADLQSSYLNDLTDNSTIKYQASIFNQVGEIFAPRYRQAHLHAYWHLKREGMDSVFDLAYSDVKTSFEHYLKYFNTGKPFIIASHSQGTTHVIRLIKEVIDPSPELRDQMVVAYLVGMGVKKNEYVHIKPCGKPDETGCFTSWRTFRKGCEIPRSYPVGDGYVATNPLSWDSEMDHADKSFHIGAVLKRFNKVFYEILEAEVSKGILWVSKPKFPFGFLLKRSNYHIADFNLFYYNVQSNAISRAQKYLTDL